MGLAMAGTAVAIIYSPWGKQSGAHINPAVTLTFWRLGKVSGPDAVFYALFQFLGGLAGVLIAEAVLAKPFTEPPVAAVATVGSYGPWIAFVAETMVAFLTMTVVLAVNSVPRYASYTGLAVGCLIVSYITFEAPLSGFSQNPARTFASAVPSGQWKDAWLYFVAPPLGMLAAAEAFLAFKGISAVGCAKLHHQNTRRCIFCEFRRVTTESAI
jgi:aquaporin Z